MALLGSFNSSNEILSTNLVNPRLLAKSMVENIDMFPTQAKIESEDTS